MSFFNPINFIGHNYILKAIILDFNQYFKFDGYQIIEKETEVIIKPLGNKSLLDECIAFDTDYINLEWKKAVKRKEDGDIEGAITIARTLIESTLKHILNDKNITYNSHTTLPKLYKSVQKVLNLAPEKYQEQVFKEILSGVSKVINGLGELRNKLGDSHGNAGKTIKPKERHGELAVHLSGSMAMFLYKTHKENKDNL